MSEQERLEDFSREITDMREKLNRILVLMANLPDELKHFSVTADTIASWQDAYNGLHDLVSDTIGEMEQRFEHEQNYAPERDRE